MSSNSGKFSDEDVIYANQRLLNAISSLDYDTYKELCAKDLTAIEPEALNNPVHGLQFHKYYFDLYKHPHMNKNKEEQPIIQNVISMASPHVRWLGGGCCSDGCGEGTAGKFHLLYVHVHIIKYKILIYIFAIISRFNIHSIRSKYEIWE